MFKNMGKMSLGFLISLKNTERGILPQYGSLLHLFPYAKSPTTTAPPLCSSPRLLHLLTLCIFPLKLFLLMQAIRHSNHCHVSAYLLSTLYPKELLGIPSLVNTSCKKTSPTTSPSYSSLHVPSLLFFQ